MASWARALAIARPRFVRSATSAREAAAIERVTRVVPGGSKGVGGGGGCGCDGCGERGGVRRGWVWWGTAWWKVSQEAALVRALAVVMALTITTCYWVWL